MHSKLPRILLITALSQLLFSFPLSAQDTDIPEWNKTREQWGQLLFCQRIYTLPEVKPRLYSFDVEQCNQALKLIEDPISSYSKQEQSLLKNQAELHAYRLSGNTSEPYHAVTACREFCKELFEKAEKSDE